MITIGRIVHYVLSVADAEHINRRRVARPERLLEWPHVGNPVSAGLHVPAVVVAVWPNEFGVKIPGANLHVWLDGTDSYWATSRKEALPDEHGTWHFPERE